MDSHFFPQAATSYANFEGKVQQLLLRGLCYKAYASNILALIEQNGQAKASARRGESMIYTLRITYRVPCPLRSHWCGHAKEVCVC